MPFSKRILVRTKKYSWISLTIMSFSLSQFSYIPWLFFQNSLHYTLCLQRHKSRLFSFFIRRNTHLGWVWCTSVSRIKELQTPCTIIFSCCINKLQMLVYKETFLQKSSKWKRSRCVSISQCVCIINFFWISCSQGPALKFPFSQCKKVIFTKWGQVETLPFALLREVTELYYSWNRNTAVLLYDQISDHGERKLFAHTIDHITFPYDAIFRKIGSQ